MTKGFWLLPCLMALAACGTKESGSDQGNLRSDMPLRTAKYYTENKAELAETDAICTAWKASQRPPASWPAIVVNRSEEHTSELQSLMRISYAVFCLKKKKKNKIKRD